MSHPATAHLASLRESLLPGGPAWPAHEDPGALLAAVLARQVALDRQGDFARSRQVLDAYEQALDGLGLAPDDDRRGQGAFRRVMLLERTGHRAESLACAEALIAEAQAHGWRRVLLAVLRRMSFLAGQGGDRRRQEALLQRALALARELGDPLEAGDTWRYYATFQLNRGNPDGALDSLQRARRLLAEGGADEVKLAQVDTPIGGRLLETGEHAAATETLRGALAIFERVGHAWGQVECLLNLGRAQEMSGELEAATAQVQQALAVMTAAGDPRGLARCGNRLGEIQRRRGLLEEARASYRDALQAAEQAGHLNLKALILSNLALTEEGRGRPGRARALVEQALALEGLQRSSEAGLRVLLLPFLEQEGRAEEWEAQYALSLRQLRNTDRFQRDVSMAARRAGELAVQTATELAGQDRKAALSRAARAHALAWHHWELMGFDQEQGVEEGALVALGHAGSPVPLGDFDLVGRLGVGGMGEVWRALHRGSGVPVAVKVLTAARARHDAVIASFRDEVRAMAGLCHPHVAQILGSGTVDVPAARCSGARLQPGSPYLVMELAPEGSLEHRCGRLPWCDVRAVLLALLEGLGHAHARGLVHRDLKPANVLLGLGHSLAEQVRLSDFGVAAAVGGGTPLSRVACGTPGYMAPEQFLARWRDQGPWTDLYALGCLATELVQGTPPFTATTIQELMRRHLTEEPPALDPSVAVPPGFEAWLQRLLEKRPRGRFQRAAEAAESLKSLGEPVLRARREPALRQYPDTVSESTLFLEEWLPQDAPPPPDVGVTPLQVALPPCPEAAPEDAWPRATLTQAGLSLFGLRVLPLVGRTAERQVLWRSLRQAVRTRRPYGVVLHGPQGIGRSRLASWIGEHAHATAAGTVVTVRHAPGGAPAAGLRSLFCDWLGLRELAGQDLAGRLADVRPGGAQLTPLEQEDLRELLEGTRDRTARDRRHLRTLATRLLGAEAGRRPVVLILDDVQWADDTLAIATALLRAAAPILLVLTARDDGQATSAALTRRLTAFSGHPSVSLLPLGPLGPEAMEALVRELLHLGPELGGQLLARAGGHPAFAVQLVADWLARGLLQTVDGALALRVGVEATVPEGLQAAWMLPVARLTQDHGDEGRDALELAAVLGQRVDDAEWLGACEAAGCPVPEALLDALLDERLVRREGAGWTFAHAPFRECLVQAAHQGGRSPRWHRACAQALAAAGGPLGRQGHHLLAGGQPGAAFEALVQALALAPADLAPELVSRLHDQALRALDEAGVASTDPRRSRLAEVRGRHRG